MSTKKAPTALRRSLGELAPKLVDLTDEVLFGDVWERPQLSKRDRSLITCAALIATGKSRSTSAGRTRCRRLIARRRSSRSRREHDPQDGPELLSGSGEGFGWLDPAVQVLRRDQERFLAGRL